MFREVIIPKIKTFVKQSHKSVLWDRVKGRMETKKGVDIMKTQRNEEFIITDGYLLVMEAKRQKEERNKFIWDVEDDSYYFEERF